MVTVASETLEELFFGGELEEVLQHRGWGVLGTLIRLRRSYWGVLAAIQVS